MQTTELNPDLEDDAQVQLNADGSLRHLLTLRGLQKATLVELLDSAESFLSPEGTPPSRRTVGRVSRRASTCLTAQLRDRRVVTGLMPA